MFGDNENILQLDGGETCIILCTVHSKRMNSMVYKLHPKKTAIKKWMRERFENRWEEDKVLVTNKWQVLGIFKI